MKTLLKISFALAIALFVSMSVNAQTTASGNITVNVPEHLQLIVLSPDVAFTYDEYTTNDVQLVTNSVEIKANVNWKFSVAAGAKLFTDGAGHSFGIGNVSAAHSIGTGLVKTALNNSAPALDATGTGNSPSKLITWTLDDLANQFAGNYQAPISYSLIKIN